MPDQTTPRPWAWRNFGGEWMLCGTAGGTPVVLVARDGWLCVRDGDPSRLVALTPDHPDAAFLLRAVNCHDTLVRTLEDALDMLTCAVRAGCDGFTPEELDGIVSGHHGLNRIRAALALAKGDKPDA